MSTLSRVTFCQLHPFQSYSCPKRHFTKLAQVASYLCCQNSRNWVSDGFWSALARWTRSRKPFCSATLSFSVIHEKPFQKAELRIFRGVPLPFRPNLVPRQPLGVGRSAICLFSVTFWEESNGAIANSVSLTVLDVPNSTKPFSASTLATWPLSFLCLQTESAEISQGCCLRAGQRYVTVSILVLPFSQNGEYVMGLLLGKCKNFR